MKNRLLYLVVTVVALLFFPKVNFGQAPNLGTAADFVLFTTNGAVTNAGTTFLTHLTGHVGANVGGSTGFGNVDGVMHDQDPASAQATLDLDAAYLQLDAAIATNSPGVLLGGGMTLVPGVHNIPAAATMNGELNLDALNDPNAIFIIQIEGAFGIAANAKVNLLNQALACNVYWKVDGAVTMATDVVMKGTIVAYNDFILMSAGDSLEGRALSINGAIGVTSIVARTPLFCLAPILTGPPNPDLLSTECFGIFSSIGPVVDDGSSSVTGDVGSNSEIPLGYNPLLVTGTIHGAPNAITAQAATDVTTVYNALIAIPYDIELLSPAEFGHDLVLTPHVYVMNGAVTFTDSLYLNAQGNPDAVFVFQVFGAFSTSTFSNIILQNGAQAKNVYWVMNGAISIADYSIFQGTIISQGSVDLLTGVTFYGRVLTAVGAVNTYSVDVIMPTSCSPFTNTEPSDTLVCDGQSASFTVTASGAGLTYQWRRGNVDLVDGGNISGAQTATLTINPATIADEATDYNVIVTGTFAPADTSIYVSLTIDSAPVITTQPVDQLACIGDSISFNVVASGLNLTYQWRKGLVNLVNGPSVSGANTSTLTINPVSLTDFAIDYNVLVTGTCLPNDSSVNVSLIQDSCVFDLSVTKSASDMTPFLGTTVTFTIIASNIGLTDGTGVEVNEMLQSGFVYVSSTTTSGTYNNITGLWTIGNMSSGAIDTLTITATVVANGNYSNSVNIYANESDIDMSNNSASILLVPTDFHIPEGFSPNDDLINDLFVIRGILYFPNNQFTVFNRWGVKVFEASNYQNTWDGTSQSNLNIGGDVLPVGTYFYVLDLGDGSDFYKGTIYLNN